MNACQSRSEGIASALEQEIAGRSVGHSEEQRHRLGFGKCWWPTASVFIVLVAAFLRFYKLDLKPLHHDEGVNAFFFLRLFQENFYQYDPANYHGPTLYYFGLLASSVSTLFFGDRGLNIFGLRFVPALFGVATVYLILRLRAYLAPGGALAGAALAAVSPGAVYFSRDFIHESIFVFLTLAVVIVGLGAYERGNPVSLIGVAAVGELLFATKETAVISVAVLVLALVSTILYASVKKADGKGLPRGFLRTLLDRFGGPKRTALWALGGITLFLGLETIFFSAFLGNYLRGPHDALGALRLWAHTASKEQRHGFMTYVLWLGREELPLLLLGTVGMVTAALKRQLFALFAGLWAFGLIAAYSIIPYKTPWLALNFVIPLAIVAGSAAEKISRFLWATNKTICKVWLGLIVATIAASCYQGIQLNFVHYDNDRYPYVYAQTRREFLGLVHEVNTIAKGRNGKQTSIAVMSPDYWPLPWYLRDYQRVAYYGRISQARADIVIASKPQELPLTILLADYERVGAYPLRPGVTLVAFARRN